MINFVERVMTSKFVKILVSFSLIVGMMYIGNIDCVKISFADSLAADLKATTTTELASVTEGATKISIKQDTDSSTGTTETYMYFEPIDASSSVATISSLSTEFGTIRNTYATQIQSVKVAPGKTVKLTGSGATGIFTRCSALTDISALANWDVSELTYLNSTFYECTSLGDISALASWNVSNVTNFTNVFYGCSGITNIQPLSSWNISKANYLNGIFQGCSGITTLQPVSGWNVSAVTTMTNVFYGCSGITTLEPVRNWNVGAVTSMSGVFQGCSGIITIEPVSNWNMTSVKSWSNHFYGCTGITTLEPLRNLDVSKMTSISGLFGECTGITSLEPLANWDVSKVISMGSVFSGCTGLVNLKGLENWKTSSVQYLDYVFNGCPKLTDISALSNWDTSAVQRMYYTFNRCDTLADLTPLANWSTASLVEMQDTFAFCYALEDLTPLANWNTSPTTNLNKLQAPFQYCTSLKDITPLENWKTGKVTNAWAIFRSCTSLVDLSAVRNWDLGAVTNYSETFGNSRKIKYVGIPTNRTTFFEDMATYGGTYILPDRYGTDYRYMKLDGSKTLLTTDEAKAQYASLAGTALKIVNTSSSGKTGSDGTVYLWDPSISDSITIKVEIDDTLRSNIPVEIDSGGNVKVKIPVADKEKTIKVTVSDADDKGIKDVPVSVVDNSTTSEVVGSGKTDDAGVFLIGGKVDPVANSTITGVLGEVTVNGTTVSEGDSFILTEGETVKIAWYPQPSGNNIKFLNIVDVNATSVSAYDKIVKTSWTDSNTLYDRKMNQSGNMMVTFDKVVGTMQTVEFTAQSTNTIVLNWVETAPVYRMYNSITSEHLFSTNKTEYENFVKSAEADEDFWLGEGIDWFSTVAQSDATVYRLYNAGLGAMQRSSHYYTADVQERDDLIANWGWQLDTEENFFKDVSSDGSIPIYTAYSEALGSAHHYTSSFSEWRGLDGGWDKEDEKNGLASDEKSATGFFNAWIGAKVG